MSNNKLWAVFHPQKPKVGDTVTCAESGEPTVLNDSVRMSFIVPAHGDYSYAPVWLDEVGASEDRALCDPVQHRSIFDEVWIEGNCNGGIYDEIEDELDAIEQRS